MPKRISFIGVFLSALFVPGFLFAQAGPSPVTNLQARIENGVVDIRWDPSQDQNISYYRVYYSNQSILENGGIYDDFEATPGPEANYILQYRPTGQVLYISVLAVDNQNNEGGVFVEETVVVVNQNEGNAEAPVLQELPNFVPPEQDIPPQNSPDLPPLPPDVPANNEWQPDNAPMEQQVEQEPVNQLPEWQATDLGGALHLLFTEVRSPTEIYLILSTRPFVEPADAPQAFSITDSDGNPLHITSVFIDRENVTVNTEVQTRMKVYEIKLSEPLRGIGGEPLDAVNRQSFFDGHPDGKTDDPSQQQVLEPPPLTNEQIMNPDGIQNLRLTTSSTLDGTYTVSARWDIEDVYRNLASYSIRQSRDGGNVFGEAEITPFTINGLDVPGVTPGEYGLGISVTNTLGYSSSEVFVTIPVGPQDAPEPPQDPPPPPPEPEIQPEPIPQTEEEEAMKEPEPVVAYGVDTDNLAQSGAGFLLGSIAILGALLGWRRVYKV